jgi:hypothetical protein
VLEPDPKQTNMQTNKKFGLHKMTKPYLDGQRKMDFLKADDSLLNAPPTKQGEKHKDNKKKEAKSALFLNC